MEVRTIGRKRVYDMFAVFVISVAPLDCNVRPTWLQSQPYHLSWGYLAVEVTWIISAGCKVQVQRFTHTLLVSALLRQRFALITYLPGSTARLSKGSYSFTPMFSPVYLCLDFKLLWQYDKFDHTVLQFGFCFCEFSKATRRFSSAKRRIATSTSN